VNTFARSFSDAQMDIIDVGDAFVVWLAISYFSRLVFCQFTTIQPHLKMKFSHLLLNLTALVILAASSKADDAITLVAESQPEQVGASQVITLGQGESAQMVYSTGGYVEFTIGGKTTKVFSLVGSNYISLNPIQLAGPASIKLTNGGPGHTTAEYNVATWKITRTGIVSPPAAIPQEAGTRWDVILESSSDLVNWTVANPGEYSGTEPKRFFRTRMVKK
jgi:hypothetical protein